MNSSSDRSLTQFVAVKAYECMRTMQDEIAMCIRLAIGRKYGLGTDQKKPIPIIIKKF